MGKRRAINLLFSNHSIHPSIKTAIQVSRCLGIQKIKDHSRWRCNHAIPWTNTGNVGTQSQWAILSLQALNASETLSGSKGQISFNPRSAAASTSLFLRAFPVKIDSVEVYTTTSTSCFATSAKIVRVPSKLTRLKSLFFCIHLD